MVKRRRTKIERHLPPIGTTLRASFNGKKYQAAIAPAPDFPDGKAVDLRGKLYKSLTGAAVTVTKQSTNGWRFWKYDQTTE